MGYLPLELRELIIREALDTFPFAQALQLRLVCRQFSDFVMSVVFDSDLLYRLEAKMIEHNPKGAHFWGKYLAHRSIGRKRQPDTEHQLLRKLAGRVMEWRTKEKCAEAANKRTSTEMVEVKAEEQEIGAELETLIHQVCYLAARYGSYGYVATYHYGYRAEYATRHSVYLGIDTYFHNDVEPRRVYLRHPLADLESSLCFHEALATAAAYLGEASLLEHTIRLCGQQDPIDCTGAMENMRSRIDNNLSEDSSWSSGSSRSGWRRRLPLSPLEATSFRIMSYFGTQQAETVRFWLGSPLKVAIDRGRTKCAAILLKSLIGVAFDLGLGLISYPTDLLPARAETIIRAMLQEQNDYAVRRTIDAEPSLRPSPDPLEGAALHSRESLEHMYRLKPLRVSAWKKLHEILEETTDLDVFNLVYPFRLFDYVWRLKPRSPEDIQAWGIKRLERAARDGCLPILERLVQLRYKLGTQPLVEPLVRRNDDVIDFLLRHRGTSLDGALAAAVRTSNWRVVRILVDRGAIRNKEGMHNAIRDALVHGREEMFMLLFETGKVKGVLNKKAKANLRKDVRDAKWGRQSDGILDRTPWDDAKFERMLGLLKLL